MSTEAQSSPKTKPQPERELEVTVRDFGTDKGVAFYGNPKAAVGQQVDMWGELLPDRGNHADAFLQLFERFYTRNSPYGIEYDVKPFEASGLFAEKRQMIYFFYRPVTVTLYVSKVSKNLYVSWRAFFLGKIQLWRVLLMLAIQALWSMFWISLTNLGWLLQSPFLRPADKALIGFVVFAPIIVLVLGFGFFFRRGDPLSLLRQGMNELHLDDLMVMTQSVHQAVIAAADKMGVDTAKLVAREPFYQQRRKPRI